MIARENLEGRKAKLVTRFGELALKKLDCIEQADAASEEMRQIAVLMKIFEVTLEDLEKDESVEASKNEQIDSMAARILDLESKEDSDGIQD